MAGVMFEPTIRTDISMLPKSIETNLDELEPVIREKEEFAKSLVVDSDSIEDCERADEDVAALRKMAKRVNTFRLDWTKQWTLPFEGVIAKCKEYERRLTEAAQELANKSEVGKQKVRDAKMERLHGIWEEKVIAVFPKKPPYFDVFFDKMCNLSTKGCWLNKTAKESAILEEMATEIDRCYAAVQTIKANYQNESEEIKQKAWLALKNNFDINEAILAVNEYKEEQKQLAQAREEDNRRKEEAEEAAKAALAKKREAQAEAGAAKSPVLTSDSIQVETYRLAVTGTRQALSALRVWGEEHGIKFKNLDNI